LPKKTSEAKASTWYSGNLIFSSLIEQTGHWEPVFWLSGAPFCSAILTGLQGQGQYAWQSAPAFSVRSLHDHEMQKCNQASQAE
jgi:hypothetical protein